MVLVLFIMYERSKGEDGFWHPYFESAQEIDLPAIWEDEDVAQIADSELISRIRYFRGTLNDEWEQLQGIIGKWTPKYFDPDREVPVH